MALSLDLRWAWLVLPLLLLAGASAYWAWRSRPPERPAAGVPVAHLARLRALPRYRQVIRQQYLMSAAGLAAAVVVVLGAIVLAARPTTVSSEDPADLPGDIVLCLEASPETYEADVELLARARNLVKRLQGERIGLVVFSDAAVTVLPLTDDYGHAATRLHETQQAFRNLAAEADRAGAASVGDGLVSCVEAFDRPVDERGRAVVLATRGVPGAGIYGIAEAGEYAAARSAVVYAVVPGKAPKDVAEVADVTQGQLLGTGSLTRVEKLERERLAQEPVSIREDSPQGWAVLVLVALGGVCVAGMRWPQ